MTGPTPTGVVYLVGAGPGDPGLLTRRGEELLRHASVVVYDALIHPGVLALCHPEAELVHVGKRKGVPSPTQDEINGILCDLARRHDVVVRLKGGDPFVFGRGGEEALALHEAGIRFEVVPGVTAGVGAPAYAGIPLTHRGISSSVAFATGHLDPAQPASDLDWERLAGAVGTVVLYMATSRIAPSLEKLVASGRDPRTPAVAIEWGTYPRQRVISAPLSELPGAMRDAAIGAPSLVVVGEVVALRDRLAWRDAGVLSGTRILVTRARAQASGFAAELEALGADVLQFPTIRIVPMEDATSLRNAAARCDAFDWIVFTSVNGVSAFWDAMREVGRDTRSLAGVSVCAIGPATAAAIEMEGARADLIPSRYVAEEIVEALASETRLAGSRILLPRAEEAREVLPVELRARGAEVEEVAAYRTVPDGRGGESIRAALAAGDVDLITFTASSTVRNFIELVGTELGGARVASIGPVTTATARGMGLHVDVEAVEHTIPGLIQAIIADVSGGRGAE